MGNTVTEHPDSLRWKEMDTLKLINPDDPLNLHLYSMYRLSYLSWMLISIIMESEGIPNLLVLLTQCLNLVNKI